MTKDEQVMEMKRLLNEGKTLKSAAMKAGMDTKTARKYKDTDGLPSRLKTEHTWRTRKDPFKKVWPEIKEKLEIFPALEAKTLFEALQRDYPSHFEDGQLRTLQRQIKRWRATEGPAREVFFPQVHKPGELGASDFTCMRSLEVTINKELFDHLLYHFVLTYSNWETGSICFSESYESLSYGLQKALWDLGGVPQKHRTDNLSAAVNNLSNKKEFTQRYNALLSYYRLTGDKIQARKANENGDVEQRHFRLKRAMDQALMLRGSRDFETRKDYEQFLRWMFEQLNQGRQKRFREEMNVLRILPAAKFHDCKELRVRVGPSSTIRIQNNVYSVHSRLIREWVDVRLYAEHLDVLYAQKRVDRIP